MFVCPLQTANVADVPREDSFCCYDNQLGQGDGRQTKSVPQTQLLQPQRHSNLNIQTLQPRLRKSILQRYSYNYYLHCKCKEKRQQPFFLSILPVTYCKGSISSIRVSSHCAPPLLSPVHSCGGVSTAASTAHDAVLPAADSLCLDPLHPTPLHSTSLHNLRPMVTPVQVRDRPDSQSPCPLAKPLAVSQY